ncbi:MAG: hypothetical protein R3C60_04260 [Parvularculaceae bacterium]
MFVADGVAGADASVMVILNGEGRAMRADQSIRFPDFLRLPVQPF